MGSDLAKLRALTVQEFSVLVASVLLLPVVGLLLKFRGFRRTERLLARFANTTDSADVADKVTRFARMVAVAANRGPYRAKCLVQAITLWWLLGMLGIHSTMRMGIFKTGTGVEAHAWVLYNGEVVLGELNELDDYVPLLDVNVSRPS